MLLTSLVLRLFPLLKIKYIMSVIQTKKSDSNTKYSEIENQITTDHGYDKYSTTVKRQILMMN